MSQNVFSKLYTRIKEILIYKTLTEPHRFVLGEGQDDTWRKPVSNPVPVPLKEQTWAVASLLSFSHRVETLIQETNDAIQAGEWARIATDVKIKYAKLAKELADLSPITLAYDPRWVGFPV